MSRWFSLLLIFLFYTQPISAQEQTPELPDYTKWALVHYSGDTVEYRNKHAGLYHEDFEDSDTDRAVTIVYKPISKEKYKSIIDAQEDGWDQLKESGLWLAIYLDTDPHYAYIFEYKRNPLEFYRLWKSKWRLMTTIGGTSVDINVIDEQIGEFLKKNYQLSD